MENQTSKHCIHTYSRRKSRREEAQMARFSLGRDDDLDQNPTNRKRLRTILASASAAAAAAAATTYNQRRANDEEVVEEVEGDDVESEEDNDDEEEDESEFSVDVDDESEEEVAIGGGGGGGESAEGADGGVGEVVGSSGVGSISVTLTDPDVLDCCICLEALTIPVFQCENGHIACASCCIKINNKCPSCSWPIGYSRCRAIEKVIESVKISCQNVKYGCKEAFLYSKKYEHEKSCIYAPCSCPLDNCDFVGSSKILYAHFAGRHSTYAKRFYFNSLYPINLEKSQKCQILQEMTEGMIFVLNHRSERVGSAVNVICIGPAPSKKRCYYDIISRDGDSRLKFQSFAESISKWSANHPLKKYLLVPSDFNGSCSHIRLELCIWRPREPSSHV